MSGTVYHIRAFDINVTDVVKPLLHGQDITALTADSEANMTVSQSLVNSWLKFKTDAIDIDDSNQANDLVFETNSNAWGVTAFAGEAVVDTCAALAGVGCQTVEYDRVRWAARDMFAGGAQPGAYGVDLLENEEQLRAELVARDSNITDDIRTKIATANGLMMNNDNDENIGKAIILKTLEANAERFKTDDLLANASRDGDGFYPFKFNVGDVIVLKVTYTQDPSATRPSAELNEITSHSYLYKMTVVA